MSELDLTAPNVFKTQRLSSHGVVAEAPDRAQIIIKDGNLPDALNAAEGVIADIPYYSRGGQIVRLTNARELPESFSTLSQTHRIKRADDQRVILSCPASYIATEITRRADVLRWDGRMEENKHIDFPERIAKTLIERQEWSRLLPLDAIVRAPFVREDGSVCSTPGYDAASRTFADFSEDEFYELPSEISQDDAADALAELLAPFDQFPFDTPAAQSAFAAHLLTEVARIACPKVPCFWYVAPEAGSGKGLLSSAPTIIVHGTVASQRPWPGDETELRKGLFSSLLAGDRSILFDNVPSGIKVRSSALCAFVTSEMWNDRKLGSPDSYNLPNQLTVTCTGNNISPAGDLARRSLVIRLNANMDEASLRQRTFKIMPLEPYLYEHRARLLRAALTVIVGHQQSGHKGPTPLPSFEVWSELVRDALIWLGLPDPCETRSETDSEGSKLGDAFALLYARLGTSASCFTPGDVAQLTHSIIDPSGKLAQVMLEAGCSAPADPQRVGYWLKVSRDRRVGDFQLTLSSQTTPSKHYRLIKLSAVDPNADLIGDAA